VPRGLSDAPGRTSGASSGAIGGTASGFTPHLVVFDSTPNPKLAELEDAFKAARGTTHAGAAAWSHLEGLAGPSMATFLERYLRRAG
jgi:hypothetical protein